MIDFSRRGFLGTGTIALAMPTAFWGYGSEKLVEGDNILVNQVGYLRHGPKHFLVTNDKGLEFGEKRLDVMSVETGRRVGKLDVDLTRLESRKVGLISFSSLDMKGHFYLESGAVRSAPFTVSDEPFIETERALLRAFYYQRCGVPLADPITGLVHGPCHMNDAQPADGRDHRDCRGGWHDAGDFGKYVATTALALGEILSLYAENPIGYSDGELDLPESGDGTPDLLSEMRIGLDWLMKMQRPYGSFDRKIAGRAWPSMEEPPENDTQERFAFGSSTGDTAKAGAALAIASRVFKPLNPTLAERYLSAAENAWRSLQFRSKPQIERDASDDAGSGAYFDETKEEQAWDAGDRLWLATELYIATGDRKFGTEMAKRARVHFLWPPSWSDASAIGLLNFLKDRTQKDISGTREETRVRLLERADEFEKTTGLTNWRTADTDFGWGSNRNLAGRGRILLAAHSVTGSRKYLTAALSQVNYILGQNPLALCYVSGLGTQHPQNIHHRLQLAARRAMPDLIIPGLLVGGANEEAEELELDGAKGPRKYRDSAASFETNEFAIDNNAALLALLGRLRNLDRVEKPGLFKRLRDRVGL